MCSKQHGRSAPARRSCRNSDPEAMKSALIVRAVGAMLTVEQRDAHRANQDPPSSAVSAGGRFVAFTTYSQLVSADTDSESDAYVLDRVTHQVTLESPDVPGNRGDTTFPS